MLPKLQWSDGKPMITPQWEEALQAELSEIRTLALGETTVTESAPAPSPKPAESPQKVADPPAGEAAQSSTKPKDAAK
jgi:hypothetical protein